MSYVPRPGSVAERALAYLRRVAPPGSNAGVKTKDFAEVLGIPPGAVHGSVQACMNHGLVTLNVINGSKVWQAGDGSNPLKKPKEYPSMQHEPRPGSAGGKALAYLRAHGPTQHAALATAIEVPEDELEGLLRFPCRMGVLATEERNGVRWWGVGDGKPVDEPLAPPPAPAPAPTPAATHATAEPSQAVFVNQPIYRPQPEPAAKPTVYREHRAKQAPAWEQPKARGFACAMYHDGRLVLEIDGQAVILSSEEALTVYELQSRFAGSPV